jgi:uncharacterized protein YukE
MHMVTESAQHAQATSSATAESLHGHVTRLNAEVGAVVGTGWHMDQAIGFANAHQSWADGMGKLIVALQKVSTDMGAHHNSYVETDAVQAGALNRIQAPMFSGVL